MIQLQNISKAYSKNAVLKDVNLNIEQGEVYGLVGKNGAGKTTLMNIIAGITVPSSGSCRIDDFEIKQGALERGYIGYLPDLPNFYEYLTGREYLSYLASATKGSVSKDIDELIEEMQLDVSKRIKALSRGNRQKLGILAAVLCKPRVLLLDEPTSALDPIGRKDSMNLIKKLKESGISIILSTHILGDLEMVCDRIGFLHNGVIEREVILNDNNCTDCFYEISFSSCNIDYVKEKIQSRVAPWNVDTLDRKLIINGTADGTQLTWSQLISAVSILPYEIKKIEKKHQHDLEQIMLEVMRS